MENHRKTLGFRSFSIYFEVFLISESSKIVKNQENSGKGGTERLREQENKANRALKVPKRPRGAHGGGKESPNGSRSSLTGQRLL